MPKYLTLLTDIYLLLPEIILVLTAFIAQISAVFTKNKSNIIAFIVIAILLCLAVFTYHNQYLVIGTGFNNYLTISSLSIYLKIFFMILAASLLLLEIGDKKLKFQLIKSEYITLLLMLVVGCSILISANDFILLYLSLELQSLVLYLFAAINRDNLKSSEAAVKYFTLGGLASSIMLFGISLIYGFAGSLEFDVLVNLYHSTTGYVIEAPAAIYLGIVMLLAGLCFKLSLVPFHFWTADVYHGAPLTSVAIFATISKVAAAILFINLLYKPLFLQANMWQIMLLPIAMLTLIIGAVAGLVQTNLKRLLGYSTITNMGFVLTALIAANNESVKAGVIFIVIYAVTNLGIFALLSGFNNTNFEIANLSGMAKKNKVAALTLTFLLFSLIGIPPLAGFFAKLMVLKAALAADFIYLVIIAILASVISAFYYLKIIKTIYFDQPNNVIAKYSTESIIVATLSSLFIILFFVNPNFLFKLVNELIITL